MIQIVPLTLQDTGYEGIIFMVRASTQYLDHSILWVFARKLNFPWPFFFFNLYGTFNKARKILQSEGWSPFRPVLGPLSWCFNWLEHLIARYCSITKLCLTLCNPMNCSKPGFPAHHHLPEFAHLMPIKLVISLLTSQSSNQIFSMGMESSQAPLRRSSSG